MTPTFRILLWVTKIRQVWLLTIFVTRLLTSCVMMVNYITVSILLNRESSKLLFFKLSQRLVARRKSKMGLNVQVVSEGKDWAASSPPQGTHSLRGRYDHNTWLQDKLGKTLGFPRRPDWTEKARKRLHICCVSTPCSSVNSQDYIWLLPCVRSVLWPGTTMMTGQIEACFQTAYSLGQCTPLVFPKLQVLYATFTISSLSAWCLI